MILYLHKFIRLRESFSMLFVVVGLTFIVTFIIGIMIWIFVQYLRMKYQEGQNIGLTNKILKDQAVRRALAEQQQNQQDK